MNIIRTAIHFLKPFGRRYEKKRSLVFLGMLFLIAIAFVFVTHAPLLSQTPKLTTNPTVEVAAKSGTYEKVACSILGATAGSKAKDNTISRFPNDAKEGKDYECGYLMVPELHSQPQGKTIQVGVVTIKSTNPKPAEPLVMFQGGPGGSSVSLFPSLFASPNKKDGQRLRADRDLIAFDKRGNRYSRPWLSCSEIKETDSSGDAKADASAGRKAVKACRDRLTNEGVNLAAFNSVESAHDVAALVNALGYKKVNLYGVSYGTELVFNIMRSHPEIVRSVVVDGIVPPNPSVDSQYAVILDRLITNIDAACAKDSDCNALYPNVKATFEETFERLNQTPASVRVIDDKKGINEKAIKGFDLADVLFHMAYSSGAPFVMPAMIYQAHAGDFSLVIQYLYLNALSAGVDDSADGTYLSVKCSEDIAYVDKLVVDGVSPAAKAWGTRTFQEIVDYCKVWNVPALNPAVRKQVVSDIPALLLNGDFDPITPPPYGKLVAQGLRNSTLVVFPANGHGAITSGSCATGIMTEFLKKPSQSPDTTCVNEQKVTFITKKNTLIAPGTTWLTRSLVNFQWGDILPRVLLLGLLMLFPPVWFVMWLVAYFSRKGQPSTPMPSGARWAPWLGVLLAVLSVVWIVLQFVEIGATAIAGGHGDYGYTRVFVGVDRSFAWIYVIPILIALLSIGMAIFAVLSCKNHYWGKARRFYYSFEAGVAIVYTLFLAVAGQLTVFFY